jgi:hypothetical protein
MTIECWKDLQGRQVLIRKDGTPVRAGRVEEVTPAADVLWMEHHGGNLRQLFEKAEGYSVELLPI